MASSSFAYSPSYGDSLAGYGSGDGYAVSDQYGNYGDQTNSSGVPFYLQQGNQQQVPLFGTSDYYNGGTGSGLIPANQSLGYTNASDSLGLVPNYQSGDNSASFSNGGVNALGQLSGGMSSGGMSSLGTAGAIGMGVGTVVGAYEGASTDTGTSVLSGVASGAVTGAEIGSIVPGVGTVIGAVAGGIIGGIAGFFGSKSKKNQEKKAFQQQEQLAVLPQQQAEANYLQNEGLKQKAISNYASGYTPGGFNYTNALTGNKGGAPSTFKTPSMSPSLPNFNVSPTNVVPGGGDNSLGIAPQSTGNNGVNVNPQYGNNVTNSAGIGNGGLVNPGANTGIPYTPSTMPTAPGFNKDSATNSANLAAYQKSYAQYLTDQNQQASAQALGAYSNFYG